MIKPFLQAIYYRLLQWTVQTTIGVCTVHCSETYRPLAESVIGNHKKCLSLLEEKPYGYGRKELFIKESGHAR